MDNYKQIFKQYGGTRGWVIWISLDNAANWVIYKPIRTWKKTEVRAMVYPKRSKEKSPSAAMMTPTATNTTESVTWEAEWIKEI